MADTIQIRAGKKERVPTLRDRELGYVRDTDELLIGTADGNKEIHATLKAAVAAMNETLNGKLTAAPVAAQAAVAADADLTTVVTALNALIAAMKGSGVMNT